MELNEAKNLRAELENQILNLINEFENQTNLTIKNVHIGHSSRIGVWQETDLVKVEVEL